MVRFCSKHLNYIKTSYHVVYPPPRLSTTKFADALLRPIGQLKENQNRLLQQTTGIIHISYIAQLDHFFEYYLDSYGNHNPSEFQVINSMNIE